MSIEAGVGFNLSLDDSEVSRIASRTREMLEFPEAIVRDFAQSAVISSSPACLVINNLIPGDGRLWEITEIGCFGPDGHTSVAGANADMYAGPVAGTDAPGDFASFIISSVIPTPNPLIGDHKAFCFGQDRIYAWIYGITSSTTITLAGTVRDWESRLRTRQHIPSYPGYPQ
jgi:hypothetical protein